MRFRGAFDEAAADVGDGPFDSQPSAQEVNRRATQGDGLPETEPSLPQDAHQEPIGASQSLGHALDYSWFEIAGLAALKRRELHATGHVAGQAIVRHGGIERFGEDDMGLADSGGGEALAPHGVHPLLHVEGRSAPRRWFPRAGTTRLRSRLA